MDTATRTLANRIALIVCLALAALAFGSRTPVAAARPMVISGATAAEERTVDWAMRRFRVGGLEGLPPLEVVLHGSRTACDGYLGLFFAGRIDLCTEGLLEPYARKFALHEMAHAWIEANLPDEQLVRFLRIRGIATWNDQRLPWKERGAEQAAEIITWGLGEGEIAPLLPTSVDAERLASLYELLTGRAPITLAAAG
jgi:hypothetical protein